MVCGVYYFVLCLSAILLIEFALLLAWFYFVEVGLCTL